MIADEIFLLITQQPEKGSDSYLKQKRNYGYQEVKRNV